MYQVFLKSYHDELVEHIKRIDPALFQGLTEAFIDAYRQNKQIFIIGNGGSAGTANHFACDFGKNAVGEGKRRFRVLSLASSVETITALGNDIAFDEIFKQQLINLMNDGDLLVAISASGNSPDIIKAIEYAREKNSTVVSLAGFQGGKIKPLSHVCLVAEMDSYERIEDIHLIILHMLVCFFKEHQELLG